MKQLSPWRRAVAALLAVALLAPTLAGCSLIGSPSATGTAAAGGLFSEALVERGTISDVVELVGQVSSLESAVVKFETVSGRLIDLHVQPGQRVTKGEPLAALDTGALQRQLREAQADLAASAAVLSEAERSATPAEVDQAEAELLAAQYEVAKARLDLTVSEAHGLLALQGKVAEAEAKVRVARENLAMVELTSGASEIRKLEYDEAFLQRSLRDAKPDDDQAQMLEGLTEVQRTLAAARLARQSALTSAQDQVASAEEELQRARARLERARSGRESPTIQPRLALEQALIRLGKAEASHEQVLTGADSATRRAAQTAYDAALAKVGNLEAAIEAATLTAPFTGVVFDVFVQPGQLVGASQNVVYLANPEELQIEAWVSEVDVVRLSPAQPVRLRFEAFPDRNLQGEVQTVSPRGEPQGDMVRFRVVVTMEPGTLDILPGMTAFMRAVVGVREDVLTVPSAALRYGPSGNYLVQVHSGGDQWADREVVIGVNDGIVAEVGSGLREGDRVRMPLQAPSTSGYMGPVYGEPIMPPSESDLEELPPEWEPLEEVSGDGPSEGQAPAGQAPGKPMDDRAPAAPQPDTPKGN